MKFIQVILALRLPLALKLGIKQHLSLTRKTKRALLQDLCVSWTSGSIGFLSWETSVSACSKGVLNDEESKGMRLLLECLTTGSTDTSVTQNKMRYPQRLTFLIFHNFSQKSRLLRHTLTYLRLWLDKPLKAVEVTCTLRGWAVGEQRGSKRAHHAVEPTSDFVIQYEWKQGDLQVGGDIRTNRPTLLSSDLGQCHDSQTSTKRLSCTLDGCEKLKWQDHLWLHKRSTSKSKVPGSSHCFNVFGCDGDENVS